MREVARRSGRAGTRPRRAERELHAGLIGLLQVGALQVRIALAFCRASSGRLLPAAVLDDVVERVRASGPCTGRVPSSPRCPRRRSGARARSTPRRCATPPTMALRRVRVRRPPCGPSAPPRPRSPSSPRSCTAARPGESRTDRMPPLAVTDEVGAGLDLLADGAAHVVDAVRRSAARRASGSPGSSR